MVIALKCQWVLMGVATTVLVQMLKWIESNTRSYKATTRRMQDP